VADRGNERSEWFGIWGKKVKGEFWNYSFKKKGESDEFKQQI